LIFDLREAGRRGDLFSIGRERRFCGANAVWLEQGENLLQSRAIFSQIGFSQSRCGTELNFLFFGLNQKFQIVTEAHEGGDGDGVKIVFLIFDDLDSFFGERRF